MTMQPGNRVDLVKRLADRLEAEGTWQHIDLVQSEFGLPTSHRWNGGSREYCMEMLRQGGSEQLRRLEEYFFGGVPDLVGDESSWHPGAFRLFISHVSAENVFAKSLADNLFRAYGVHGFVAHEDIEPNTEWLKAILAGLGTCDALVALLHPPFKTSNWTDQEVGFVLGRSKPVISVRLGADPYGFFGATQALPG